MEIETTIIDEDKKKLKLLDDKRMQIAKEFCGKFPFTEEMQKVWDEKKKQLDEEEFELNQIVTPPNIQNPFDQFYSSYRDRDWKEIFEDENASCPRCGELKTSFAISEKKNSLICMNDLCPKFIVQELKQFGRCWPQFWFNLIDDGNRRYLNACQRNLNDVSKGLFKTIEKHGSLLNFAGVVLSGGVGSGKTYFMFALMRHLYETGVANSDRPVFYFSESQFFSDLKSKMDNWGSKQDSLLKRAKECSFLFYDDLGAAAKTLSGEWGKQIIFEIIDAHYTKMTPIFITTNLEKPQIFETLGQRTADRLNTLFSFNIKLDSLRKPGKE